MATVSVTIQGMLYDKVSRTYLENVTIVGDAWLTGLAPGGGPIVPPDQGGGGKPPGIWGPTDPRPTPPIANVPGLPPTQNPPNWGAHPEHPIVIPPPQLPPDVQPPTVPQPGDPTTVIPGNYPVAPIVPAPFLIVNYPGIGLVKVAPPVQTSPTGA